MSRLLALLGGGDLRSDGAASEVAQMVCRAPSSFPALLAGLDAGDDVVRGRAADALEKVSREHPELFVAEVPRLVHAARHDPVAMVRWHAVMILSWLLAVVDEREPILATLLDRLTDTSAFVRSWAIAGLCWAGREFPDRRERILARLAALERDPSAAVRKRAARALLFIAQPLRPLPPGWWKGRRRIDPPGRGTRPSARPPGPRRAGRR